MRRNFTKNQSNLAHFKVNFVICFFILVLCNCKLIEDIFDGWQTLPDLPSVSRPKNLMIFATSTIMINPMFRQLNCLNYRYPSIPSCLPGTAEYTTDESKAIQNRCDHQILLGARFYWIDGIDCDFNECGLCDALVRRLYYFHLYHWLPWVFHCL